MAEEYLDRVKKRTKTTKIFEYQDEKQGGILVFLLFVVLVVVWMVWDTLKPSNFFERAVTVALMLAAYFIIGRYPKVVKKEEITVEERE